MGNTSKPSPGSSRLPMPREQRAKQFAPFDALTGLHERLHRAIEEHRKEREVTTGKTG